MNKTNYMQRTRDYYRAQGFEKDYVWAHYEEIPFTRPSRPLDQSTVTIVTTAVADPSIPKLMREAASYRFDEVPDSFDTSELAWDRETTHTRDRQSYFPLEILRSLVTEGRIGRLAERFHFVPTDYSQKNTLEKDAPRILEACRTDQVDIAILIPL